MDFIKKIPLLEVPTLTEEQRKIVCKVKCGTDRCFTCNSMSHELIQEEIFETHGNEWYLYLLLNTKIPKTSCCPWCSEKNREWMKDINLFSEHLNSHGKTHRDYISLTTQKALWKECYTIRRTGRWWMIGLLHTGCRKCLEYDGAGRCSIAEYGGSIGSSRLSNMRCIHSLYLTYDETELQYPEENYGYLLG